MISLKQYVSKILIGVIILVLVIPFNSSRAANLITPASGVSEELETFLPVILNGNPKSDDGLDLKKLIFTAAPIQGELDTEDIFMIKTDGTELANLTNDPAGYFDLVWSPDGSRFAFYKQAGKGEQGIYIMNADGTGLAYLAYGASPSWSPDGSKIVYEDFNTDFTKLSVINSDGTGLRELVSVDDGNIFSPEWSPKGNKIAYWWSDLTGNNEIFIVNSDGSDVTNLTNGLGGVDPIRWSPDGSQILFSESGEIYIMNADGTGRTNISNSPDWYDGSYAWSPDGSKIAYECENQICVMNPDGTGTINVSGEISAYSWHAWSPDGSALAFIEGSFASNHEIFLVNSDGTGKTLLTDLPSGTWKRAPAWQP